MVNFGPLADEIGSGVWVTANFNGFRVLTALLYCTALYKWASAKLCGVEERAPPIFGRAAITLGIGPHSSFIWLSCYRYCANNVSLIFTSCKNIMFLSWFVCLSWRPDYSKSFGKIFTVRRHASAVYAIVCLSQVCVVLKRLNVGSCKQRHTIAQRV